MERYIGLDVHAQSCTLAVLGPSGRRLRAHVLETNGQVLVDAIKGIVGKRHLCLEEGTQSAWLHELLAPHVDELVVTVPHERKGQKNNGSRVSILAGPGPSYATERSPPEAMPPRSIQ